MIKVVILLLVFLTLGLGYWWWKGKPTQPQRTWQDRQRVQIQVAGQPMTVEVVNQPASITLGLGERTEIGADGMLFVLPTTQVTSFWMKGMSFDLDLIWIRDNRVIGVTANVPAMMPETAPQDLPLYPSPVEVDMVLEIPAGQAEKKGIVTGANLELK